MNERDLNELDHNAGRQPIEELDFSVFLSSQTSTATPASDVPGGSHVLPNSEETDDFSAADTSEPVADVADEPEGDHEDEYEYVDQEDDGYDAEYDDADAYDETGPVSYATLPPFTAYDFSDYGGIRETHPGTRRSLSANPTSPARGKGLRIAAWCIVPLVLMSAVLCYRGMLADGPNFGNFLQLILWLGVVGTYLVSLIGSLCEKESVRETAFTTGGLFAVVLWLNSGLLSFDLTYGLPTKALLILAPISIVMTMVSVEEGVNPPSTPYPDHHDLEEWGFVGTSAYQDRIRGVPGSVGGAAEAFGEERAKAAAAAERESALLLDELIADQRFTVFHGLRFPGSRNADIDHAVVCGNRVLLIDTKCWRGEAFSVDRYGSILVDGRHVAHGESHMPAAAEGLMNKNPVPLEVSVLLLFIGRDGFVPDVGYVGVGPYPSRVANVRDVFAEVMEWAAQGPDEVDLDVLAFLESQRIDTTFPLSDMQLDDARRAVSRRLESEEQRATSTVTE